MIKRFNPQRGFFTVRTTARYRLAVLASSFNPQRGFFTVRTFGEKIAEKIERGFNPQRGFFTVRTRFLRMTLIGRCVFVLIRNADFLLFEQRASEGAFARTVLF